MLSNLAFEGAQEFDSRAYRRSLKKIFKEMVNILKYLMLSDGQNISGFQESVLGVETT